MPVTARRRARIRVVAVGVHSAVRCTVDIAAVAPVHTGGHISVESALRTRKDVTAKRADTLDARAVPKATGEQIAEQPGVATGSARTVTELGAQSSIVRPAETPVGNYE